MRALIIEDDPMTLRILTEMLQRWGYDVEIAEDGNKGWNILKEPDCPQLVITDWMMPGMDGPEVCRRVREERKGSYIYIIILTAKNRKEDIVGGFEAGADDYATKPFNMNELRARVRVGERTIRLQNDLENNIKQLQEALDNVKQLQGLLPICSYCKRIRDDSNYWTQVESYITDHSDAQFSHSICPECFEKIVQPQLDAHGITDEDEK